MGVPWPWKEERKKGKRDEFLDKGIAPRELVEPKVVKKK